jgi:hypothetical protein
MKNKLCFAFLFFMATQSFAQVSEIKGASSSNSRSRGERGGGSRSSGLVAYFFIDLIGSGIVEWQRYKLAKVDVNPSVVSLEVMTQAAIQPSTHYVFHPRIRGNWGLFSTDFRVNYLVEEEVDGFKDLATYDWQVIQLNLITTRNVIGRVGIGVMQEDFGTRESFGETTAGMSIYSNKRMINGSMEYRWARDWSTGSFPRKEFNAFVEHQVFGQGRFHGFVTLGGMYQRYYDTVNVWGVQTGFVLKLH